MLKEAEKALAAGAAVIIYPESTATRDPDLWPMVAKTGVARLALATGAPVIPVAHWGTQDILPYGSKKVRLFPRKTVRTVAGPPVDLSQWAGQKTSAKALRAATVAIMADVTALVAQLRKEEPPAVPYDPSLASRTVGGDSPPPQLSPDNGDEPAAAGNPEREPKGAPVPGLRSEGAQRPSDEGRDRVKRPEASAGRYVKAAVLGAGSWGTTFAQVLCDAGTPAVLWARGAPVVSSIMVSHENPGYLPGISLPASLTATTDPAAALDGADLVVFAVPAQTLRSCLASWAPLIPPGTLLVSLLKGIELGTCKRMSEVIVEVLGVAPAQVAVVSGPNLAREIAERQFAASVVACTDEFGARLLQRSCHTGYFRPYWNTDVTGCELGGAVKNIIALAVGIAVALGLGDNTKATLITRGLAEMARLGEAMGADPRTFAGLAGMGDLVATCSSPLSRNRTFGLRLGQGMTSAQARAVSKQTAEGVTSYAPVLELARKHGVEMPITEVVAAVIAGDLPVGDAAAVLASRSAKPEWYGA